MTRRAEIEVVGEHDGALVRGDGHDVRVGRGDLVDVGLVRRVVAGRAHRVGPAWRQVHVDPGASCAGLRHFVLFGEAGRMVQGLQDVLAREVGVVGQRFLDGDARTDLPPRSCRP